MERHNLKRKIEPTCNQLAHFNILISRAISLSIGGWLQIGAKDWFEREFFFEKFDRFVKWTKKTSVQVVCMIINLALIAACIILMVKNGGINFTFAPLFLS